MSFSLILLWVGMISALTTAAAYSAKKFKTPEALTALYVTLVIFANLSASKIISFNLGVTTAFAPAAVVIFAVTFLLTDIVNEKFGRSETQKMILIALFCQMTVVGFSYLILGATPAPFFEGQNAFTEVFGTVPKIIFASLIAFFVSENADAYIFSWFKKTTQGEKLWLRNAFSSIPAMLIDSAIFICLAFWGGSAPIFGLILGQTLVKWFVAIIDIPFMYWARKILK